MLDEGQDAINYGDRIVTTDGMVWMIGDSITSNGPADVTPHEGRWTRIYHEVEPRS